MGANSPTRRKTPKTLPLLIIFPSLSPPNKLKKLPSSNKQWHLKSNIQKTSKATSSLRGLSRLLILRVTPYNHHNRHGNPTMFDVISDTTRVLGIQLRHATTKHDQTIGILERCHASLKNELKISTGERRTMWHQLVPIVTLNYNATYHSAHGCEPSRVFHGRVSYNVLDLKLGLKQTHNKDPTTDKGEEVLQKTRLIHESVRKHHLHSYIRYKQNYDRKATARPLETNEY